MQELKDALAQLQSEIDSYKPATKWEEANGRTLKRMIARRNALEKAIERREYEVQKEKTDAS